MVDRLLPNVVQQNNDEAIKLTAYSRHQCGAAGSLEVRPFSAVRNDSSENPSHEGGIGAPVQSRIVGMRSIFSENEETTVPRVASARDRGSLIISGMWKL